MSATSSAQLGRLRTWVERNSGRLASAIVLAGFAIRFIDVRSCYLNPDEAAHYNLANAGSWAQAYESSLSIVHPPLLILVLHGLLFLGRSEWILRLPSLLGGSAALWLTFAWIRRSLGQIPSLAGLIFMAISPAAISASTEVRQYGLLVGFVCASLYATERLLAERTPKWAAFQALVLVGALMSTYTSLVVLISLGIYTLFRSWQARIPRQTLITFIAGQLSLVAITGCLYFTNIHGHSYSPTSPDAAYLQHYFFAKGNESFAGFVWRSFTATLSYLIGLNRVKWGFLFAFLTGLAALLAGRTKAARASALLIALPFAVGFAMALLRLLPFSGSRHQAYLLPFVAAGISASFAALEGRLAAVLLVLLAAVSPLWLNRTVPDNDPHFLRIGDMAAAIDYIHQKVPRGEPLFVDYETGQVLLYYLTRSGAKGEIVQTDPGIEWLAGGYRLIAPREFAWAFLPDTFIEQVNESAEAIGAPPGQPLWVISSSWLESSLASRVSGSDSGTGKEFGRVSVIEEPRWSHDPIAVNWSSRQQTIDGFGAGTAGVNPTLSPDLMDFFYTDIGIHLTFMRVAIWPSFAECEAGLDPGECVASSNATISKRDLANARAALDRGAQVWGSEWSPPGYMKSNRNFTVGAPFLGGTKNFTDLAKIQTSFVSLLTGTYGIPLYALSPQNEPDKSNADYQSSLWSAQQFHDYVPYLARSLREAGYGTVKIMIAEQSQWDDAFNRVAMSDPAVASNIGILAAHGYGASDTHRLSWPNLTTQRVWQTETSTTDAYDGSIANGLKMAKEIHGALTAANVNSWNYWSLSGILFSDNEGLTDSKGNPAKRAYALGNFSRFVLPGWTRVTVNNGTGMLVSAYRSANAEAAIVVVNRGKAYSDQRFTVDQAMGTKIVPWITSDKFNLRPQAPVVVSNGSFTYTIPESSIVTFVSSTHDSAKNFQPTKHS